jgi:thiosulfate/3-mercaptopyruvate sulfurtransferase
MSDIAAPLVDVKWVQAHPEVLLADLRWTGKDAPASAAERYAAGHLPGAVFVDLDRDLARPGGPGRHPFPPIDELAATLGRLGISDRTHVVVYDDGNGSIAARLWFMLRVHGHGLVSVLEGGLAAWTAAGLPLETAPAQVAPVPPPRLVRDESRLLDRAAVEKLGAGDLLLDARAPERYRGEVEPIDRRAGHIPGAVNAPFSANLREGGRFRPPEELRELYCKLGADRAGQIVASCGSGVTACHDLLALELAGFTGARLYVGSWSDWSSDPAAPIATGPSPR